MGTKQSKQALIDRRHRPLARSCETEQVINLAHGLSFGRLRSHISSGYARFNGGQLESNLYDPVVLAGWGKRVFLMVLGVLGDVRRRLHPMFLTLRLENVIPP